MMKSSVKPCMFKNPSNPIVDGGPDEDEKSYLSEFDVNKIEESAGSINDSNNGRHDRTDDMVEEMFTQKTQSTSAFLFAVWQEVDDATLTDDEASDYEDPLSTDLVQDEGYIEGEDVDMLDRGGSSCRR